ncbi:MAG: 23S rRNA (guanosine(2251)-2'-O)-methyltransferase RlmB [Lachnospiraceae bacterium]|nr:23S rRNA (guanosine(2251)-2'-O)-methyltransferase RlmB [Lachnospiraceae bacterium]
MKDEQREDSLLFEGRNEVIEALRAGKSVEHIYMLDGAEGGAMSTIRREAKKAGIRIEYVDKSRLDRMSETHSHQGVMARIAAMNYAEVDDILRIAGERGEDPFLLLLDGIEDPHNLGAVIRTANVCGAHGVVIMKDRAVGLTATVAKASAGAINHTPVARVTNLSRTIEELKEKGLWFVCADMDGQCMYEQKLTGPIGVVIGAEGKGVSRLVKEKCDFVTSIPVKGEIESLNASVAAGVLCYEIVRQRLYQGDGSL